MIKLIERLLHKETFKEIQDAPVEIVRPALVGDEATKVYLAPNNIPAGTLCVIDRIQSPYKI